MMPAAIRRRLEHVDPDLTPPIPEAEPDCTCRAMDGGANPTCPAHGWWTRDPHALHLATLTRELDSAWEAAKAKFGDSE